MNLHDKTIKRTEVTTGPLSGSRKVYSAPDGHDDLAVPFREIALSSGERLQRSTTRRGPLPIPTWRSTSSAGWPPCAAPGSRRAAGWRPIRAGRSSRRTTAMSAPRISSAPSTSSGGLCAGLPASRSPSSSWRGPASSPARWSISPIARISDASAQPRRPKLASPTARASARRCPISSRRTSCAAKSRAAGPSSPPISTTPNPSR